MDFSILLLAGFIVFLSQFVKGFSGFGSGLFAMPFLVLLFDIKFALAFTILLDLVSGSVMLYREKREVSTSVLSILVVGILGGAILGGLILPKIDFRILKKLFGVTVVLMAAHMFLQRDSRRKMRNKRFWGFLAGFTAGLTGVLFGVNGPPVVYYANQSCDSKRQLRATLYFVFLADSVFRTLTYAVTGVLGLQSVSFALLMVPFLFLGIIAGNRVHFNVSEKSFKRVITLIVLIVGLIAILR